MRKDEKNKIKADHTASRAPIGYVLSNIYGSVVPERQREI